MVQESCGKAASCEMYLSAEIVVVGFDVQRIRASRWGEGRRSSSRLKTAAHQGSFPNQLSSAFFSWSNYKD